MGNTPSTYKPPAASSASSARSTNEILDEKAGYSMQSTDLTTKLRGLQLDSSSSLNSINPISIDSLEAWESKLLSDPKNKLAQAAITKHSIETIVSKSTTTITNTDKYLFNVELKTIGLPLFFNNQNASGRCWIFATCNVLRQHVIKNYNLDSDKFQFSQSYLFAYDKLEKSNYFLDNILETADEELDSRLIAHLFLDPISDGGQWDMIVNLVNKYGLVPQEVFPDSENAKNSRALNGFLVQKLREYALILRNLKNSETTSSDQIQLVKQSMMKQVYNIITISLGTPPKPNDSFNWEFVDKLGKFQSFATNPLDFYASHVRYDADKHFSLLNDPRNEYYKLFTVDKLKNISDGKPIEYVNLPIEVLKKVAIKMLQKDEPIFFGSDVLKFGNSSAGVLDIDAYDYELGYGTNLKLNKEERVRTGNSAMNHAMVITGVHLDSKGLPVRWKIENSWGDAVGDKGYFLMTDKWFEEYVFQIVTNKSFVDKEIYDIWKGKDYRILPYYDPMGSLA